MISFLRRFVFSLARKSKKKPSPGWRKAIRGQVKKKTLNAVDNGCSVAVEFGCCYQPLPPPPPYDHRPALFRHLPLHPTLCPRLLPPLGYGKDPDGAAQWPASLSATPRSHPAVPGVLMPPRPLFGLVEGGSVTTDSGCFRLDPSEMQDMPSEERSLSADSPMVQARS